MMIYVRFTSHIDENHFCMKKIKLFLVKKLFLLNILLFLIVFLDAQAQGEFKINAVDNCIGLNETKTYTATVPSHINNLQWVALGDLQIVEVFDGGLTAKVRSTNVGKGNVLLRGSFDASGMDCGEEINFQYPITSSPLELYKIFTPNDSIVGNSYVSVGNTYTYSINPIFFRNIQSNIGYDTYKWIIPSGCEASYYSQDSSSVTIQINRMPTEPLKVAIGKCTQCIKSKRLTAGAKPTVIKGYQESICLDPSIDRFGVKVQYEQDHRYEFSSTNPSWGITKVGNDSAIFKITKGVAGDIIVKGIYQNDTNIAILSIFRPLDDITTKIEGETCLSGNEEIVYSIHPSPNEAINWQIPANWVVLSADKSSSTIILRPTSEGVLKAESKNCPSTYNTSVIKMGVEMPETISGEVCFSKNAYNNFSLITNMANASYTIWEFPEGWNPRIDTIYGVNGGSVSGFATDSANIGQVKVSVKGCKDELQTLTYQIEGYVPPKPTLPHRTDGRSCVNLNMKDTIRLSTIYNKDYNYFWTVPANCNILSNQNSNEIEIETNATNTAGIIVSVYVKTSEQCQSSEVAQITQTTKGVGSAATITNIPPQYLTLEGIQVARMYNAMPRNASYVYHWLRNDKTLYRETGLSGASKAMYYSWGDFSLTVEIYNPSIGCYSARKMNVAAPDNSSFAAPKTGISETKNSMDATVNIHPNPSKNTVTVKVSNSFSSSKAYIRSLAGTIVYEGEIKEGANVLDVSTLKTGTYIFTTVIHDTIITEKIQIVK